MDGQIWSGWAGYETPETMNEHIGLTSEVLSSQFSVPLLRGTVSPSASGGCV